MEEDDISSRAFYRPLDLLQAVLEDDWKAAEAIIQIFPYCVGVAITKEEETALHFAAAAKQTHFVEQLVKCMAKEDLELRTSGNYTALYIAAQSEIVTIAEVMVKKNNNLPLIPKDDIRVLPLYAAIMTGNRDMVSYLYSVTPIQNLASLDRIELLKASIQTDLYDTALKILDTLKLAPEEMEYFWFPLKMLARKPSEIGSKSQPSVWERCLNSCSGGWLCNKAMMQVSAHQLVYRLWEQYRSDENFSTLVPQQKLLVVEAAKVGNVEFLVILIRSYPLLIWQYDKTYGTLFHVAVKHRQESVFNLIYERGVMKRELASIYAEGNKSMLHLAAELPSSDRLNIILGPALQMQRELLWFQNIEKIVPKSSLEGQMGPEEKPLHPWEIFVETHEELRKNGEKWMKETASSCMLVAALIATVAFPAVFTVPGGKSQGKGITLFFFSNAMAMVFSSTSIFVLLKVYTTSYMEKDFLVSLPAKLLMGLYFLSISIIGMLAAFTVAFFLVIKGDSISHLIVVYVVFHVVSVILSVIVYYIHLLLGILRRSIGNRLFRSQNRLFSSEPAMPRKLRMTTKLDKMTCRFQTGSGKKCSSVEQSYNQSSNFSV